VIGEKGFKPVRPQDDQVINVGELGMSIDRFLEQGQAKEVGNRIELDLGKLGYTKLLGDGRIHRPVRITVEKCTEKAMQKIGQAGGEVIVPKTEEAPVEAEEEKLAKARTKPPAAASKPTKPVKG
jgi:large subunit ribosomal protein L15